MGAKGLGGMMRILKTRWGVLSITILLVTLVGGCRNTSTSDDPSPVSQPPAQEASWRTPSIAQFREAYEWGAAQGERRIAELWVTEGALILSPLATAAAAGQVRASGLSESELVDIYREEHNLGTVATALFSALQVGSDFEELQELLSNKLTVFVRYEGTIWDADYRHEAQITQGEKVIDAFDDRLAYNLESGGIYYEARFKVEALDPESEFWCTVTQDQGGRRFLFRIDPEELGSDEFF